MNIATRLKRAEQVTKTRRQAVYDTWLREMPHDDLLAMLAFVEVLFFGEEEKAFAMLPEPMPEWFPTLTAWIESTHHLP